MKNLIFKAQYIDYTTEKVTKSTISENIDRSVLEIIKVIY